MRRLLLSLLLALPLSAQFAFVTSTGDDDANVTLSPSATNVIIFCVRWEGNTTTNNASIAGNSQSATMGNRIDTSSGDHHVQMGWILNASAGTNQSYTATLPGGASFPNIIAAIFSASETPTLDDQNAAGTGSGTGTSLTSDSITTDSGASDWLAAGCGSSYSGGQTYSAQQIDGTNALGHQQATTGAGGNYSDLWWRIPTGAITGGTATATNNVSDDWAAAIASFKFGTGGGGGGSVARRRLIVTQ